ncbi:60S ribosomal protein L24 [Epichloe bromicola]|uniref:Ribosome biogenesis protein RLP24 n=1 Tax=Epichloe bromicola TaxID=79588 RepID=A0ABQ0CVI0_9HYPO
MRVDPCYFCGRPTFPSKGIVFNRNDGRSFRFCRSKCHKNFKHRRNPNKLKWTKASRIKAGKEMTVDSTLLFSARRNVPVRYNRHLMEKTIQAMARVSEIRARRERAFYKRRMVGKKARELALARKLVAENEHLLPRMRGSELRRLKEAAAMEVGDVAMEVDQDERIITKRKNKVFGGEQRKLRVRANGDIDMAQEE